MSRAVPGRAPPLALLIDDAEDDRELYGAFLRLHGWAIATAGTGEEALARAAVLKPAVIVLDLGLPGMDGWELARRLKVDAPTSGIPIIAVTGHAEGASKERALAAGVDAFLVKPCVPSDLLEEIQRQLARRRP